jgi:hypothetical protein
MDVVGDGQEIVSRRVLGIKCLFDVVLGNLSLVRGDVIVVCW